MNRLTVVIVTMRPDLRISVVALCGKVKFYLIRVHLSTSGRSMFMINSSSALFFFACKRILAFICVNNIFHSLESLPGFIRLIRDTRKTTHGTRQI